MSKLGRSKDFPQTSQGSRFRVLRGLFPFFLCWRNGEVTDSSEMSPKVLAVEWVDCESPDTDLSSSSSLLPGNINEVDRSRGVSKEIGEIEILNRSIAGLGFVKRTFRVNNMNKLRAPSVMLSVTGQCTRVDKIAALHARTGQSLGGR